MPQGKGTYGSKKGRPPKKMWHGGPTSPPARQPLQPKVRPMPDESKIRIGPNYQAGGKIPMYQDLVKKKYQVGGIEVPIPFDEELIKKVTKGKIKPTHRRSGKV